MKKLFLTSAMILTVGISFGQPLQKGNFISLHVLTLKLEPGVTLNQYLDFYVTQYIPEWEKNFPGAKLYIASGIRGENQNSFGLIYYADSEKVRDKYFAEDGSANELRISAYEKLQPITEELQQLGTYTSNYTDWVIQ